MKAKALGWWIVASLVALWACGVASAQAPATVAGMPATVSGMPATRLVSTMSQVQMEEAVAPYAANDQLPITSSEVARLRAISADLSSMTIYDAAIAEEIASQPLIPLGSSTGPVGGSPLDIAAGVHTGMCYDGVENSKHYSDPFGFGLVIDSGISGYCDGPGNRAIVATGNYEAGIRDGVPDGCNAANRPVFHHEGEHYIGSNPMRIGTLNTFEVGYNTPFGCAASGIQDFAASALWVNYAGDYGPQDDFFLGWGNPGWGDGFFVAGPYTCCGTITNN